MSQVVFRDLTTWLLCKITFVGWSLLNHSDFYANIKYDRHWHFLQLLHEIFCLWGKLNSKYFAKLDISLETLTILTNHNCFGNYPNKISENFLAPNASGELTTESETKTDVQKETEVTEPQNFVPGLILPPSATGDTVTFWRWAYYPSV